MEHNQILAFLSSNPAIASKLELLDPYVTSPIGVLPTDLQSAAKILKKPKEELLTGDCVVCSAANSGYHFGCIACAACSAFFRRTVALHRAYHCRRDPSRKTRCPLDRRHRSNCKACRFSRCLEMGMNPSGVQNLRDPIRTRSPGTSLSTEIKCEIMEEGETTAWSSPNVSNPSIPEKYENIIDTLSNAYNQAVERRRMFYCNGSLREMLDGDGLTMRPTKFDERYYKEKMRFELVLYLEMMNSLNIFKDLTIDVKEALVKNCAVSLALLEKYHISIKNGGMETQRIIAPDGSYTDLSDRGAQFDNEIFAQIVMDKETCLKLLYDPLREVLQELGGAIEHAKMTDVEYCALFAVLLFNSAAENLREESKCIVSNGRNRIMKDWFEYYEKQGIEPCESSLLVGNTLLLLTAVRNALHVHRQNFHVIRVFNVMEYDKLIDDLTFG